jgi:protein cornichon
VTGEAWIYLFSVIVNAVNLFMQVFFTIMYSDLEVSDSEIPLMQCDYINPIDLCNKLNMYIVPEMVVPRCCLMQGVHVFLTLLFLMNGYWLALFLNIPLLAWNVNKYPRCPGD